MKKTGGNAKFRQTIFVSIYRESALGTRRCFTKDLVARILHGWSRGISRFSVAIFLYQCFEIFHRELFVASRKLWQRKVCMDERRRVHLFPSSFFLSHNAEYFYWEHFLVPEIFPVAKTFYGCEGGYHVFPRKKLSITVPKSFIGNASCFEKVSGFWRNKWSRRGVSRSSVKTLVSCYRKDFWVLFGVSKKFWQQKNCMDERGGYQVFRLIFLSHITESFLWVQFHFSQTSGSENISWILGGYRVLPSKPSGLTIAKTLLGSLSVFQKLSVREKFLWMGEGDITFFSRKVLNHSTGEFHWEIFVVSDTF